MFGETFNLVTRVELQSQKRLPKWRQHLMHRKSQMSHLTHLSHSGSVHGQNDSKICKKFVFFVRVVTHYGSNESSDSFGFFCVVNHFLSKSSKFCIVNFGSYDFVQITPACDPNMYQIIYGETLDFQSQHHQR